MLMSSCIPLLGVTGLLAPVCYEPRAPLRGAQTLALLLVDGVALEFPCGVAPAELAESPVRACGPPPFTRGLCPGAGVGAASRCRGPCPVPAEILFMSLADSSLVV